MSEKTSKFGDVEVIKKEFHASKKPTALNFKFSRHRQNGNI